MLREVEIVSGEDNVRDDDLGWPWLVKLADLSDSAVSDPGGVKRVDYCLEIDLNQLGDLGRSAS
jgi:hypothetical protein